MEKKYGMETKGPDALQLEQIRADMQQRVRTHYQSRMVAVTIPFFQAVFSGFLAGVLVGGMIWFFGGQPKYVLAGLFFTWIIVTGIVWILLVMNWNSLVWNVETALGVDLTGDGIVGPVATAPRFIQAEVSRNGGQNKTYVEFVDNERLGKFFQAVLAGADLSEARWTPAKNGFSKSEYWNTIGELIKAGALRWRNDDAHAQGIEVTLDAPGILSQWLLELGDTNPLPHRD